MISPAQSAAARLDGIGPRDQVPSFPDRILYAPAKRVGRNQRCDAANCFFGDGADDRSLDPAIAVTAINGGADQRAE